MNGSNERVNPANALDLSTLSLMQGVEHRRDRDGALVVRLLTQAGAYGVVSPPVRDWWWSLRRRRASPAVVYADVEVYSGAIGVSLFNSNLSSVLSGERRVTPSDGRTTVSLYVDQTMSDARLMVRTYGANRYRPRARIQRIRCKSAVGLTAAEVKRIRASAYTFWYYSMDLGDGVVTQAGTPDAPHSMAANFKGRGILQWLLDRYFGGLQGKTVIEPGCSGGFHTLSLARLGAHVTAYDVDEIGLGQARLAAESLSAELQILPTFHRASIYDFVPDRPADIVYCSGLLYHLPDVARAAKIIFDSCVTGAVVQTSISTLPGDVLEFAGTSNYPFAIPRGEFAFIPSRRVLPKIFEWAGFTRQYWFDVTEFTSTRGGAINYRPRDVAGSVGPVYGALLK